MRFIVKIILSFSLCILISLILWEEFVHNRIYSCVWGTIFVDFFFPENWYHGSDGGDMIKPGWTVSKLKTLRDYIIGFAFFISTLFTLYSDNIKSLIYRIWHKQKVKRHL